jgi:septal ring factor EnvC (AmiA/AmiB activator)
VQDQLDKARAFQQRMQQEIQSLETQIERLDTTIKESIDKLAKNEVALQRAEEQLTQLEANDGSSAKK